MNKTCLKCGFEFPFTVEFFLSNGDKPYRHCKVCASKERKERRNTNEYRIRQKEYQKKWRHEHPEQAKAICKRYVENHRDRVREFKNRWNRLHPEKARSRAKEWYYDNHEYALDYRREHGIEQRTKNRLYYRIALINRRAKIKEIGGEHSKEEISALFTSQGGKCKYCGCDISKNFHIDHFIPISKGGRNSIDNLVLSCPPCNLSKGSKLYSDWITTRRETQ